MKRDLELIRKILLAIEEKTGGTNYPFSNLKLLADYLGEENNDENIIKLSIHVRLLIDADYLEVLSPRRLSCSEYYDDYTIKRITNNGCDYIDNIRDKDIWQKTQEKLQIIGGSAALDVIKSIATQIILKALQG